MVKKIFFRSIVVITGLLLHLSISAQTSLTVHVETAGTLSSLIGNRQYEITDLMVTGNLNGTDILCIKEMAGRNLLGNPTNGKLANLNLSGTNIVKGGRSYYDYYDVYYGWSYCYTEDNTMSDHMFSNCTKLKSITMPNSVTLIYGTFAGCTGLTSIIIPNSVTSIESFAFYGCTGLTSTTIPNSVTYIGDGAFYGCKELTSIIIPNSVTSIDWFAFYGCTGLTSIIIPNSVTSIGRSAFEDCTGLTSVTIGSRVTSIYDNAFKNCKNLAEIHIKNPSPPNSFLSAYIKYICFEGVNKSTCILYIPKGSKSTYQSAFDWKDFYNIIETDFTAINTVNKDNTTIKSISNGISIETNIQTPVSIYNLSGQKVYQSVINGSKEIPLNKGVYIVSVNNKSEKVIVH